MRFSIQPLHLEGIFSGKYWLEVLAGFGIALEVSEERNTSFHRQNSTPIQPVTHRLHCLGRSYVRGGKKDMWIYVAVKISPVTGLE